MSKKLLRLGNRVLPEATILVSALGIFGLSYSSALTAVVLNLLLALWVFYLYTMYSVSAKSLKNETRTGNPVVSRYVPTATILWGLLLMVVLMWIAASAIKGGDMITAWQDAYLLILFCAFLMVSTYQTVRDLSAHDPVKSQILRSYAGVQFGIQAGFGLLLSILTPGVISSGAELIVVLYSVLIIYDIWHFYRHPNLDV